MYISDKVNIYFVEFSFCMAYVKNFWRYVLNQKLLVKPAEFYVVPIVQPSIFVIFIGDSF